MVLTARKIAVTVNSRQYQGISVLSHKKSRTIFVVQYGSDVFCSGITKNPSRKTWIFSFVPQGTTSFACLHATSFERQLNIIDALRHK